MQLTAEQEHAERENGELLASIANVDSETARRVLRKHNGDMEKAADALLTGDRGETWEERLRTTPEPGYNGGQAAEMKIPSLESIMNPSSSVIDLTSNDDEMSRAIQMSMQESSQPQDGPQFGPSERAPHPEWQMVRSNVTWNPSDNYSTFLTSHLGSYCVIDGKR